jgi:hypothetical protein
MDNLSSTEFAVEQKAGTKHDRSSEGGGEFESPLKFIKLSSVLQELHSGHPELLVLVMEFLSLKEKLNLGLKLCKAMDFKHAHLLQNYVHELFCRLLETSFLPFLSVRWATSTTSASTALWTPEGLLRAVYMQRTVAQDKDGSFHCRSRRLHELMNVSSMYQMFGGRWLKWAISILCPCCSEDGVVADDSDYLYPKIKETFETAKANSSLTIAIGKKEPFRVTAARELRGDYGSYTEQVGSFDSNLRHHDNVVTVRCDTCDFKATFKFQKGITCECFHHDDQSHDEGEESDESEEYAQLSVCFRCEQEVCDNCLDSCERCSTEVCKDCTEYCWRCSRTICKGCCSAFCEICMTPLCRVCKESHDDECVPI